MAKIRSWGFLLMNVSFVLLLGISEPLANPFHDPMIPNGQILTYQFHGQSFENAFLSEIKRGEEVESIQFKTEIDQNPLGQRIYRITERGQRRNGLEVVHVFKLLVVEGTLRPLSVLKSDYNKSGRVIRSTQTAFDDATVNYPDGTIPVVLGHHVLRGAEFKEGSGFSFLVLVEPMVIFRLLVEVEDIEEIEVPAGRIRCYRMELKPDLRTVMSLPSFLTRLLQPFMPKYYFWYSTDASHPLVKFKGNLGGTGAGEQVWELKEIKEGMKTPESISKSN